jgi:hypothetical protein
MSQRYLGSENIIAEYISPSGTAPEEGHMELNKATEDRVRLPTPPDSISQYVEDSPYIETNRIITCSSDLCTC